LWGQFDLVADSDLYVAVSPHDEFLLGERCIKSANPSPGTTGIMMPSRAIALIGVNYPGLTPVKALRADPG
jgi:hypothetical protein